MSSHNAEDHEMFVVYVSLSRRGWGLLSKIHVKFHVGWQGFLTWLLIQSDARFWQSLLTNMDFNMEISLIPKPQVTCDCILLNDAFCLFHSNFTEVYSWGSYRSLPQTPQCTSPISHNAPFCNRKVHVCTFLLQNDALWDICLIHCHIIIINYFTALSSQFVGKCQPLNPWKLLLKTQKYNSMCVQLDLKQKLSKMSHEISFRSPFNNVTLRWRHNECDSVSNNQPNDCLLNRLSRRRSK